MRRKRWTMLLLVPMLLSGCGALGMSPAPGGSPSPSVNPSPGPGWIVVAPGSATGSPSAGFPSLTPAPGVGDGFLPIVARPTPTRTRTWACAANMFTFTKIAGAGVVAGTTSAVVGWYNVGGFNLMEFRVTAISQDLKSGSQRDIGWVTAKPSTPCGQMSATITGLDRTTGYVFSVDAVVLRHSGSGTRATTIARSGVVRTS
jgi:hypothetical protein